MTHHRTDRRVVLWKRDTSDDDDANLKALRRRISAATFKNIFTKGMSANEAERHAIAGETGASLDDVDAARRLQRDDTTNTSSAGTKHVSSLADLLVEASGGKVSRGEALHYLLHHRDGRALAQTRKQQKEPPMTDTLQTLVKDYGIVSVAKGIVDRAHSTTFTEEEFTKAITAYADAHRLPGESSAKAFARVFTADDEIGLTLRKAHQIVKNGATMTLTPDLCRRHRGNRCQRSGRRARTTSGAGRSAARQHAGAVEGSSLQQDLLRPEQRRPGRCRAPAEPTGRLNEVPPLPVADNGPVPLNLSRLGRGAVLGLLHGLGTASDFGCGNQARPVGGGARMTNNTDTPVEWHPTFATGDFSGGV